MCRGATPRVWAVMLVAAATVGAIVAPCAARCGAPVALADSLGAGLPAGPAPRPASAGRVPSYRPEPLRRRPRLGLLLGGAAVGTRGHDGFATIGLTLGEHDSGALRSSLLLAASWLEVRGREGLGRTFEDAMDIEFGVVARHEPPPPDSLAALRTVAGVTVGTLSWEYSAGSAPDVPAGAQVVTEDHVDHLDAFAGAGVVLVRLRRVWIGGTVVAGARFYARHTHAGFELDEPHDSALARAWLEAMSR